jgi:hypothetical protein
MMAAACYVFLGADALDTGLANKFVRQCERYKLASIRARGAKRGFGVSDVTLRIERAGLP